MLKLFNNSKTDKLSTAFGYDSSKINIQFIKNKKGGQSWYSLFVYKFVFKILITMDFAPPVCWFPVLFLEEGIPTPHGPLVSLRKVPLR